MRLWAVPSVQGLLAEMGEAGQAYQGTGMCMAALHGAQSLEWRSQTHHRGVRVLGSCCKNQQPELVAGVWPASRAAVVAGKLHWLDRASPSTPAPTIAAAHQAMSASVRVLASAAASHGATCDIVEHGMSPAVAIVSLAPLRPFSWNRKCLDTLHEPCRLKRGTVAGQPPAGLRCTPACIALASDREVVLNVQAGFGVHVQSPCCVGILIHATCLLAVIVLAFRLWCSVLHLLPLLHIRQQVQCIGWLIQNLTRQQERKRRIKRSQQPWQAGGRSPRKTKHAPRDPRAPCHSA